MVIKHCYPLPQVSGGCCFTAFYEQIQSLLLMEVGVLNVLIHQLAHALRHNDKIFFLW